MIGSFSADGDQSFLCLKQTLGPLGVHREFRSQSSEMGWAWADPTFEQFLGSYTFFIFYFHDKDNLTILMAQISIHPQLLACGWFYNEQNKHH